MAQREKAVNDDLRVLCDAHRLGQMSRAEFRARRRHLLIGLADSDGATARNPVTVVAAAAQAAAAPRAEPAPPSPRPAPRVAMPLSAPTVLPTAKPSTNWLPIIAGLVLLLVLAGAAFWFTQKRGPDSSAGSVPKSSKAGDPAVELEQLATRFVEDNRWEVADIDSFLRQWRAADASLRATVTGRPALQQLRQQIADKLRVTRLLLDDAAPDSGKAEQVRALENFGREIGS